MASFLNQLESMRIYLQKDPEISHEGEYYTYDTISHGSLTVTKRQRKKDNLEAS